MRSAFLLPLGLLLGCAAADRPVSEAPTGAREMPVTRAFDVPELLGLNADQIARPLTGQSIRPDHDQTPRELPSGTAEAQYTYWHDTTALVVSYDPATLRVNNYFIKTKHGFTSDYTALLQLFGISKYDKRMSLEPIASVDYPRLYTGVKVTSLVQQVQAAQQPQRQPAQGQQ